MTLEVYQKKRTFKKTPEPKGKSPEKSQVQETLSFVIQKHRAQNLHFDFRLEQGNILKSWAIPKGPPLKAGIKRLAVLVEDHPLEYKNFEGTIPEGNYGAGTVEIWDKGTYKLVPRKNFKQDFEDGHLTLMISGKKLKGEFALVQMKNRGLKNWLMIKAEEKKK